MTVSSISARPVADTDGDLFDNSAHPPIHRIDAALSPEEFELVFQGSRAEAAVFRIIAEDPGPSAEPCALSQSVLTLYRREADGLRQVGIQLVATDPTTHCWILDEPELQAHHGPVAPNDPADLTLLAASTQGRTGFEIEDSLAHAGRMPLVVLLRQMEAARIGRPSTYAATLKKLFEESSAVVLDPATNAVALTPNGVEIAARLITRCDDLSALDFARAFDAKINAVAAGDLPADEFLAWVLSLTHPGDATASVVCAKLWRTVDELTAQSLSNLEGSSPGGGYIGCPVVSAPDADAPPPVGGELL